MVCINLIDNSNYLIIDCFPDRILSSWSKNDGITCMDTSDIAFEGLHSLKLSYRISDTVTTAYVSKVTKLSASRFSGVSFRIKGPYAYMKFKLRLKTGTGDWETCTLGLGKNEWKWFYLPWNYFRKTGNLSQVATSIDMGAVKEFRFELSRPICYDTDPVLAGTLYLDDIKFVNDSLDDFESGIENWMGDSHISLQCETESGNYYEGEKALKCSFNFHNLPDETKLFIKRDFQSILDGREFNGISIWVKGDGSGNFISLSIHTLGNCKRIFETKPERIGFIGWKQLFFFWGQFYSENYCRLITEDLTNIESIAINIIKQGCSSSVLYFDSITFTSRSDLFANLDLNLPQLKWVKAKLDICDYEAAKSDLLLHMKSRISPHYYFCWKDRVEIMERFNESYPGEIKAIERHAKLAQKYDFTFEGDHRLLDPDGDNHIEWFQGNSTFTSWLSSMAWWPDMGKAYWNSWLYDSDESYVESFTACMKDFIEKCPPPHAVINHTTVAGEHSTFFVPNGNMWNSLFTGIRLNNWSEAYAFFIGSDHFNAQDNFMFLSSILEHAEMIYDYEGAFINDNFQLVECSGLYTVAVMFPEFSKAELWKKLAVYYIECHMYDNVQNDGFYKELTFGYHEWMIDFFYKVKVLGDLNSEPFSKIFMEKLEKMFEVIMKLMKPNGTTPMISDSSTENKRQYMSLGAALFGRGDFKYLCDNKVSSSHFWTTPLSVLDGLKNISAKEPEFLSVKLKDSKYYYMRSDWIGQENALFFDGAPYLTGHYHHDQMNIEVIAYGDTLIIDPGKGSYSDDDNYVSYFVATEGHNTIRMDNYENPYHVEPKERIWETNKDFDLIDCEVDYSDIKPMGCEQASPYKLRRRIYFSKPKYWIMNDRITAEGLHNYQQSFHFAPLAISFNNKTKAVTVNNYIDSFERESLEDYDFYNCSIRIAGMDHKQGNNERCLAASLAITGECGWFKKNVNFNACHVAGIAFVLKAGSCVKVVKPFITTESGTWSTIQDFSRETQEGKEIFIPWRLFANEKNASHIMSPYDASMINEVGFYICGDAGSFINIANLRFYNSYDICNFESRLIESISEENVLQLSRYNENIKWTEDNRGKKCLEYKCNFIDREYDYVRVVQHLNGSKLGGIVAAIRGTASPHSFSLYVKSNTGVWISSKRNTLFYEGWKLYYFPWRDLLKVSDSRIYMTASDSRSIDYIEFRFFKDASENKYPIIYIDSVGFFDYFQEKNQAEMGLDTWTVENASIKLDSTCKYEGDYSMRVDYEIEDLMTVPRVIKSIDQYVSYALYGGIALCIKEGEGDKCKLRLMIDSYVSPEISLCSCEWNFIYIPWSDFRLENNSTVVMGEPYYIGSIEIRISSKNTLNGTINIDNITLIGRDRANITILPVDPSEISDITTCFGWVAYNSERYESAPYIKYSKKDIAGNTSFNTVIVPGRIGMAPKISVFRNHAEEDWDMLSSCPNSGLSVIIED